MRDPNRMRPTLDAVLALWQTRPYRDMRLGQLLFAIAKGDPFHLEDTDIQDLCADLIAAQQRED